MRDYLDPDAAHSDPRIAGIEYAKHHPAPMSPLSRARAEVNATPAEPMANGDVWRNWTSAETIPGKTPCPCHGCTVRRRWHSQPRKGGRMMAAITRAGMALAGSMRGMW